MTRHRITTTVTESAFRTNPSAISRYFFHDCERFFRYTAAGAAQRKLDKVPAREFDHSPLMKAILESGYSWEQMVLDKYLKGKAKIAPGKGEVYTRRFDWAATVELLRTAKPDTYIYQPTLRTPKAFYDRYGIDPALVTVSDNHPDLIAVLPDGSRKRLLRVLDVKRGESLKLTHRVQILLYALQLADILAEEGITDAAVDLAQGAVWLGGQPEPTTFDLADFRPHLETFLHDDLMRILRADLDNVNWHVYFRCEWCEYFEHCREQVRVCDDVSRLAYLSTYGKRHLTGEAGVRTISQLGTFLRRKDADQVLSQCASLAGQRPFLSKQVSALKNGTIEIHGASSPALPCGENIRLFLTLQDEPLGQSIYLAGVHLQGKDETLKAVFSADLLSRILGPKGYPQPLVFVAEKPNQTDKVRADWIHLLYAILVQVDAYNKAHGEWSEQISLQAYVHNEREKTLLVSCLMDALTKPKLAKQAMTLLFHFQAPELMNAEQHPDQEVPYPVVVLMNALGRLMALPIDISYTLPETLQALGSTFKYQRNDYFHFPLGHGLRAEAIHAAWYRGKSDNVAQIARQASFHLYAVSALLQAIRTKAGNCLFAWPPQFLLPGVDDLGDTLLSRLAFFTRYEGLIRCLELRDARCEPRETQALMGQVLELVAQDGSVMDVVGEGLMEVEASTFANYLLVEDSEAGRRAQLEYKDYYCRNAPYKTKAHPARAVVAVSDVVEDEFGFPTQVTVTYQKAFSEGEPAAGERLLLYPRYTDWNSDRVIGFLKTHVDVDGLFVNMLRDPVAAAGRASLPKRIEEAAGKGERRLGLTPSQLEAYRTIRQQRLVPVWGPPGTGKTHFLAAMILGLSEAHAQAGRPFRVLVTAFTHAAIENVLRKTAELRLKAGLGKNLRLGKAKNWQGTQLATADVVYEKEIAEWVADNEHSVLGATVYSGLKAFDDVDSFDLVIIDEASQLRVPESAIPISLVADGGRLVLAGDHLQLPPIVAGVYPEAASGEPILHRSIFEALCPTADDDHGLLKQLTENFRMNDVLTSFAASLLYGPDYKCVDGEVAGRRLNLTLPRGGDPLVKACLDPEYPLVIVVLEGVRAAKENQVEAELVAKLVNSLRDHLKNADGEVYDDDSEFFHHGVFIVSPHRAQIRTIQRTLRDSREWEHTPFVDTVDKMQGQEADAVIVSYGVADPEFAMQEADFIYGLNRLNVAVTRAKTKCVVCLPRPLLDATPHVLDQPEAARGLAFMRRLVMQTADSGEELSFDCGDGVTAVVYRSGKCVE